MYSKQKIKSITFVIASLGGGGAERVLSNLANYFSENGIKVDIVYSFLFDENPAYDLSEDIKIHKLPDNIKIKTKSIIEGKKNTFLIIRHLRNKFKELDPDVIVSFMDKTNIYSIIAHIGLKTPLIISERTNYHALQRNVWRKIRKAIYPFSDGMVVLSKYDYEKYDYVENKKIIFNPINIGNTSIIKFEKKEKIILAVGRLDTNKGFDMLIKAISKIDIKEWKVIILGEGSERNNLKNLISKYNLDDKISLLGRKDNIDDYYIKASIFVLSSKYEGFPNALTEAMSFGCSCVSFDCLTGPSDIIKNDENGILIEVNNIDLLSKKINYLIENRSIREKYFNEAIKIRKKLNLEYIAKEWEDYFNEIKKFK